MRIRSACLVLACLMPLSAGAAGVTVNFAEFQNFKTLAAPFIELFSGFSKPASGITPEAIRARAFQTLSQCVAVEKPSSRYDCYQDAARALLLRTSFRTIDEALAGAEFDCHDLMHSIAQQAYEKYGSLGEVYQNASFSCFGAAYHGAAEGYLMSKKLQGAPRQSLEKSILTGCREALDSNSPLYMQCVHGIGHALMFITASELPESLTLCDTFANEGERVNCYGGVFMENVPNSQLSPHVSRYIRDDDLYYPCTVLAHRYQSSCYHFQFSRITEEGRNAAGAVGDFCAGIPEEFRTQCYKDAGLTIAAMHPDLQERISACEVLGGGNKSMSCIRGVVRFYLDRFAGVPEKLSGVFDFCAAVSEEYAADCYNESGQVMAGRIKGMPETLETAAAVCAPAGRYTHECSAGVFTKQVPI